MTNLTLDKKLTLPFLKVFFNNPHFSDITLAIKHICYKCNGKGFYYYYDPILDMQGYYDCDDAPEPESVLCSCCDAGHILFKFSTLEELKSWVEKKIQHQDWTYNYSDDIDVRSYGCFYQSIVQELL